jgi:nitrogen regulatory protein PII
MNLARHPKKRIEIIVEAPALHLVLEALDGAGVSGYTVFPALEGRGHHGGWTRDDSFNNASHMVAIVCITGEEKAEAAVAAVYAIVERQIAILSLCDVEVVRPEHF